MSKKRSQKTTVYVSLEGRRERVFYDHLYDLYDPKSNNINITENPKYGGSSDIILAQAIKMKNNYKRVYAWFDEDIQLSAEIKEELSSAWGIPYTHMANLLDRDLQRLCNGSNKNPRLIVSSPCSVDGLLINICGKNIPEDPTTQKCKDAIAGITGNRGTKGDLEYFQANLSKEDLESINNIECLPVILSIFKP